MKKRLLLHRNKRAGGAKAQKSISEAACLLDRWEYQQKSRSTNVPTHNLYFYFLPCDFKQLMSTNQSHKKGRNLPI
jgi:hypothetical protein